MNEGGVTPFCRPPTYRRSRWREGSFSLHKAWMKWVWFCCLKTRLLHPEYANRQGPFILAVTHLSHLEPVLAIGPIRRRVDWMARAEFYDQPVLGRFLDSVNCFKVYRDGVPVSAIRQSVERLHHGRIVGICPEGGVTVGPHSVIRGGSIKRGIALVAQRAQVPTVPCVVIGSHLLNRVDPWLPLRRGAITIGYGPAIDPPATAPTIAQRKPQRIAWTDRLIRAFGGVYQDLRDTFDIADEDVP